MDTQVFTQMAVAFFGGMTAMNIFINFIQLCIEEMKKCSIMDRSRREQKKTFWFGKKEKKYAVLRNVGRVA